MLIIFVHEGHKRKLKFNLFYNYHYILEITYSTIQAGERRVILDNDLTSDIKKSKSEMRGVH